MSMTLIIQAFSAASTKLSGCGLSKHKNVYDLETSAGKGTHAFVRTSFVVCLPAAYF